ncbi:MAG TPA: serine--tRNA ligase [Thermoanaerobaculia bacterium]|jgi:seryl-tRNA synthetase|nr:serine--tRNA ligase [Thermoanaerobaculia bacterium]
MLSRDLLRDDPEKVRHGLANRNADTAPLDTWLRLDAERRADLVEVEELKRQRNEASRAIGEVKKRGGDASGQIAAVGQLKSRIEELEARLAALDPELLAIEQTLPNLPHPSVPVGKDETDNRCERTVGIPRTFDFSPKAHWDLGPELGILDFERGAKLAGARFTASFGAGALLERSLSNFMLDLHTRTHGYTEVLPPFIVNRETLVGTGQLPKFEQDLFHLEGYPYYLIPTAEVPVTNLHRDETLDESALPVRYTAWTPCFRSEAGSYGKDVRGLIRQHQFNKVELVQLTTPETSYAALEELTGHAEVVLQLLELPYRVMTLSTGDMGFGAAKTYDLEVWLPGQQAYREISSCSNCEDFQARRANLRYRPAGGGKTRLLHTLNGSGLAVGRTLIAVLENYQQPDGSVLIPKALRPYTGGLERITTRK